MRKLILLVLAAVLYSAAAVAQSTEADYIRHHYTKVERYIPMRDGVKLFTSIYIPKDHNQPYPFLISRTPYTVAPYGKDKFKTTLGPDSAFAREGYIFVYQDVRGKWMSEGTYEDIRPHVTQKNSRKDIDESSDTYDTIDWLLKNIPNNNGRAGIYGISYPGFYATAALPGAHPALKAASPQAPVTDWFRGDDFHHNGAFFLMDAFNFYSRFGVPRPVPLTPDQFHGGVSFDYQDNYRFFLELGALPHIKERYFGDSIGFWNDLMQHGTLDTFWRAREIARHLTDVKPAVMTVGGFFDAEDAFGPFEVYKTIEANNPDAANYLVMGPWFHGGWVRSTGNFFGDIRFNKPTSAWYQRQLQLPFFNYYLKDKGTFDAADATIFISGSNEWKHFDTWPPRQTVERTLYLHANGSLGFEKEANEGYDEYVSDPASPVPYQAGVQQKRTREYMVDDQRFAARRPDVQVYRSDMLTADITLAGPLVANLFVSTTGTDADYVVKLIDEYPADTTVEGLGYDGKNLSGYQMMVRGEVFRGKFRNGFEHPEPFVPGEITSVSYNLPDVGHTFKKGHRIMIQVQNSWFPLVDRNPQQFLDIYQAKDDDFIKATHRIYHGGPHASYLRVQLLQP
ncbi:CocE/NonD family hydrolase [Parapedobacter sp.]